MLSLGKGAGSMGQSLEDRWKRQAREGVETVAALNEDGLVLGATIVARRTSQPASQVFASVIGWKPRIKHMISY